MKFSPFFTKIVSFLEHFCTYLVTDVKDYFVMRILMACTSCTTSYGVLSHSHGFLTCVGWVDFWGFGRWGFVDIRGVVQEILKILDLERLASLCLFNWTMMTELYFDLWNVTCKLTPKQTLLLIACLGRFSTS